MKFALDKKENYTVFSVMEEKLNSIVAPSLKTELAILNNEGIRNIILDLNSVRFIDSSGLSAILVGNRLCLSAEGRLILTAVQENVSRLIKISQLDSVLNLIPTVQESKDYVMMNELMRMMQSEEGGEAGPNNVNSEEE